MPINLQYIRYLFTNFSTNYYSLSISYMPVPTDFLSWYTRNAITIRKPEEYYVLIKQNLQMRLKMKSNDTEIQRREFQLELSEEIVNTHVRPELDWKNDLKR